MFTATAPAKIILCGEHAVVYGQPALAIPLSKLRATAQISTGTGQLILPDLGQQYPLNDTAHPLHVALQLVQNYCQWPALPTIDITVQSEIPVASGLGSGAAIATALIRALLQYGNVPAPPDLVCRLSYEVEKLFHGTPSGIDNTVVAYEKPVYFRRQEPTNQIEPFSVADSLTFLIADTGVASSTKAVVGDVRRRWEENPSPVEALFAEIGRLVDQLRHTLTTPHSTEAIGTLLTHNHYLLQQLGVSSAELDHLVNAALHAGAWGAKLSGAGRGGNLIALIPPHAIYTITQTLFEAGAKRIFATTIQP